MSGLPCSGKTTIAKELENRLDNFILLDGDTFRNNLPFKFGFSKRDRDNNIKLVRFIVKILCDNGMNVVCSFVTPYEEQRQYLRNTLSNYVEVWLSTPLEVCEKRDVKGMYKKARNGEIKNFTGIDDPYEKPQNYDIELDTCVLSIENCVKRIQYYINNMKR